MVFYVHEVPGRVRIKIPMLKRNKKEAETLRGILEEMEGVVSTSTNTVTGSVVINYDDDLVSSQHLLDTLADLGYIDLSRALNNEQYVNVGLSKAGRAVSKAALGFALDRMLGGSPLSIITAFI